MEANTVAQQQTLRPRSASLTIRGFDQLPEEVASLVGIAATSSGLIGTPAKSGAALLKRSYVLFRVELPPDTPLFHMVPAILEHMGGADHLAHVLSQVAPEHVDIDLVLPVKDLPEQEGGFISPTSIAELHRLGTTISFSFLNRVAEA